MPQKMTVCFNYLMKSLHCLRDRGDNGGKIGRARQTDVEQRLLVRIKDALNALHARCCRNTVQSKAVACGGRATSIAHKPAEAIRGKQLAGVITLKDVADSRNGGLVPVTMKPEKTTITTTARVPGACYSLNWPGRMWCRDRGSSGGPLLAVKSTATNMRISRPPER